MEFVTQPDGVARPDSSLTVPPEVEYLPSKSKTFGHLKMGVSPGLSRELLKILYDILPPKRFKKYLFSILSNSHHSEIQRL